MKEETVEIYIAKRPRIRYETITKTGSLIASQTHSQEDLDYMVQVKQAVSNPIIGVQRGEYLANSLMSANYRPLHLSSDAEPNGSLARNEDIAQAYNTVRCTGE